MHSCRVSPSSTSSLRISSVQPTRVAHVLFCDVVVKERFIVSDVPSPWVALGPRSSVAFRLGRCA